MNNIFKGDHYYDLAKQAKFQPNPWLSLLLCFLVTNAAQSIAAVPMLAVQIPFALSKGAELAEILMGTATLSESDAGIMISAQLFSTVFIAAVGLLFCRFIEKRSFQSMGLHRKGCVKLYALGMLLGMAAFSAVVGISLMTGAVFCSNIGVSSWWIYLLICTGWIIQGAEEEIMCRGYLMTTLSAKMPMWAAVLVNSAFFSLLHILNPGVTVLALVNILLVGIMLSLLAIRCDSLIPSCAVHSVWNCAQGNFYGLPVSGMQSGPSVFHFEPINGMELWTGGSFGLESGLGATIVTAVVITALLFIPRRNTKGISSAV